MALSTLARRAGSTRWTPAERRRLATGLFFISPAIIGFLVFIAYPIVASFYYSFTRYDVLSPPKWVGLSNYRFLLTKDDTFWRSIYTPLFVVLIGMPIHP